MRNELTFAGLDALVPRVLKVGVAFIATLPEPSTVVSATTEFFGLQECVALGAYDSGWSFNG